MNKIGKNQLIRRMACTAILALFTGPLVWAQPFHRGLGLRLGNEAGITYKVFQSQNTALEGILSSGHGYAPGGLEFTGLYEWHFNIFPTPNLYAILGAGGHLGVYQGRTYYDKNGIRYNESFLNIGVDGLAAVEYKFADAPISLTLDVKPRIDLINPVDFDFLEAAISVRFTF